MVSLSFSEEGDKGVATSLSKLELKTETLSMIKKERELWLVFGKMNSNLYRGELMAKMVAKGLSGESMLMVYFMAGVIKSKTRIVKAMDKMSEDLKKNTWWFPVKDFYMTQTTQYVSAAGRTGLFPVVNIPNTNPGLDLLVFCLITGDSMRTMENLARRPTFSQMNLDAETQTLAKAGYEFYWTRVIQGSKNEDKEKLEKPGMKEDYYNTSASDKYSLIKEDLTMVKATVDTVGYTKSEVERYLRSFDEKGKSTVSG
jgi:hypothetical protein